MIEANNLGSSPSLENTIISQAYIALQVQGFVTSLISVATNVGLFLDHIWVMFCIQDLIARPIHCTDDYPSIYFMPRFMASEVPIMEIANSKLLQIFTAPPVPTPPQWVILAPIFFRRTSAAAKVSSDSAPTMNVRVPADAALIPPDTGASTN